MGLKDFIGDKKPAPIVGVEPRNLEEKRIAGQLTQELRSVVQVHLGGKLARALSGDTNGKHLRPEDQETILIGLALRMPHRDIMTMVNTDRINAGLIPATLNNLTYYQKKYGEIIDELYANIATRIGEIYGLADKVVRIARLHEMGDLFYRSIVADFNSKGLAIEDGTNKKANIFIRIMDRMNVEMGGRGMAGLVTPREDPEKEAPQEVAFTSEDVKQLIDERFSGQLPPSVTEKIDFTDYTNCALGERMGASDYICWSAVMTKNNPGGRCSVQTGSCKKCPKFINKTLLDDKEWFIRQRQNHLTLRKIASAVGCAEWDDDVKDKMIYYGRKHDAIGVPGRKPEEDVNEFAESGDTESQTAETSGETVSG